MSAQLHRCLIQVSMGTAQVFGLSLTAIFVGLLILNGISF
jgi:hypothetical protein